VIRYPYDARWDYTRRLCWVGTWRLWRGFFVYALLLGFECYHRLALDIE
jgi:hypothetical protein